MQLVKTHLHTTGELVLPKYWTPYHSCFMITMIKNIKIYFKDASKTMGFEYEKNHFVIKQGRRKLFEFIGTSKEVKEFVLNFLEEQANSQW